jgi:cobalt-zinc-cadmium resistance protein CzcA
MLRAFFKGVVSQRVLIMTGAIILIIAGLLAWDSLPVDAFPDVTNVQVMILTQAPGMAPIDVESQVTYAIELQMSGLPEVKEIRSLSKAELSQVVVVFNDGIDIYFARQVVFERLQSAREKLPDWANPELGPVSTGLGEIYQYTLESDQYSLTELRTMQDWLVAPMFRPLPGVTEVNSFGGFIKQFQIQIDPVKLEQYDIDIREVISAVGQNNANTGGGYVARGEEQTYIRCVGLLKGIDDIKSIILKSKDGTPVQVQDIADVVIGTNSRQGAVSRDGKGEVVCGMIILLKDANSRKVVNSVKATAKTIQDALPAGVTINAWYDRTSLIVACISTITKAIKSGAILVVICLVLLLGSIKTAIVVLITLPFTALLTFIVMNFADIPANLMSLGGLAVAIGMVVDSAIMVAENILRRVSENATDDEGQLEKVISGACAEVARPLFFAEAIIIVTFFPLFTLVGMEGKMFHPLAATLSIAIIASVISAFTFVPAVAAVLLRHSHEADEGIFFIFIRKVYAWTLEKLLCYRKMTMVTAIVILAAAIATIPHLGTEFIPDLDEGAFAINVVRLPSASLDESVRQCAYLEQQMMKLPEVKTVISKTGRAAISEDPMGPEQSDIFVMLKEKDLWRRGYTKATIEKDLRVIFDGVPGIKPGFSQPIALRVNELISGVKSELAVKVFGNDLEELKEIGTKIANLLSTIKGSRDIKVEQVTGFPQLDIIVDRNALARYHMNANDIALIVETALAGKVATSLYDEDARFDVTVRLKEDFRQKAEVIGRIPVKTPDGYVVQLQTLAKIVETEAPAQISREDGTRRIVVEMNIEGRDTGGFVAEVQEALKDIQKNLPSGYYLKYGGTFENQKRAEQRLSIVVPVSIALIFVMLLGAFSCMRTAFLVLANLPFALIGGVATAWITGTVLSVPAVVGFIALFGTSTQDGVVLVSFINDLRKEGKNIDTAIREGCSLRLKSVILTSVTTICGLIPLTMATGTGAEIQKPLATVVLGGMCSALILVLLVLPVMYRLWPPHIEEWEDDDDDK